MSRVSAARTAVVWDALRAVLQSAGLQSTGDDLQVLDIGGGTGGFAVGVAELGHRVLVVDPSPDALAILDRRSEESGVADRVTGVQGDLSTFSSLVGGDRFDVVLCHGVLGVVDDPGAAVAALTDVLVPGGVLSLLVGQRHAAVVARAMAGHFEEARTLLGDQPSGEPSGQLPGQPSSGQPRRFTAEEITALLVRAGFRDVTLHGVRVFGDIVPGSLVDEPGAAEALATLERAVTDRAEYLTLAAQIHALATLDRPA